MPEHVSRAREEGGEDDRVIGECEEPICLGRVWGEVGPEVDCSVEHPVEKDGHSVSVESIRKVTTTSSRLTLEALVDLDQS